MTTYESSYLENYKPKLHNSFGILFADSETCISRSDLLGQGPTRRGEVENVVPREDEHLNDFWESLMLEVSKGWVEGPFNLHECCSDSTLPVSRFVIQQGEKKRPIDNFRRSGVNRATRVRTPIVLSTVDHLASRVLILQEVMGEGGSCDD